jgi:tRNA nucleotidyltransferase (CCA-adding enzyme)
MNVEVSPPDQVRWVWRTLEEAGFETWVVGGAIRDLMFGRPSGDWDFATKAHPKQIMEVFRRTVPIGVDHGTVGVLAPDGTLYEVTTFRRDVQTFGRRAVVAFAETIEEDLSRRDFTINAIGWHPGRDQFLDPWDGAVDLKERILRTVGEPAERFAEDLLRVLRALRFAGQFSLTIEAGTWQALLDAVPELSQLSAERTQEEMMKVMSQAERPSVALGLYATSGVLGELYPEVEVASLHKDAAVNDSSEAPGVAGAPTPQDLALVLRACDTVPKTRPLVRLAVLFALVSGTPLGSEQKDAAEARRRRIEGLMERLRFSNADRRRVAVVAAGLTPTPSSEDSAVLRRWLNRVGPEYFSDIARGWLADARAREGEVSEAVIHRIRTLRKILQAGPPLAIADLALDGSDLKGLGLPPGPQFGEILRYLLEKVLDRPELNNREDLEALAREGGFLADAREG